MNEIMVFGEKVNGYEILVLNEREVRAAAGLMFLATFISFLVILFHGNFVPIKYVISIFLTDFCIRLFLSPKYSPILIIGRSIVSNQNPEYVAAEPKKFAWFIGLVLSASMFVLLVIMNAYSFITGVVCLVCLVLMFFETAFGICLGCKIYHVIKNKKAQHCPGDVCDSKAKQDIQKISKPQIFTVLSYIALIFFIAFLFNEKFKEKPHNLFQKNIKTEIKQ